MECRTRILLLVAGCFFGLVCGVFGDEKREPSNAHILVAKVRGDSIDLEQIDPGDRDVQQAKLSKGEFDKWLAMSRATRLLSTVSARVMAEYAIREQLRPSRQEFAAMIAEAVRKHPELVRNEQDTAIRVFWLRGAALDWIIAKALYEKYGGPIAISSFGAYTSIAGRTALLKEYVKTGSLTFYDTEIEREFWARTYDERVLDVTIKDPKKITEIFAVSPWERWFQQLDSIDPDSNTSKASGRSTPR
jgi:hypothetical protein